MDVAGADGCRAGWLVVRVTAQDDRLTITSVTVERTFAALLASTRQCAAVAVDIPIGLTDGPPREADREARKLLGRPRASSVFPAPIRPAP